MGTLTTSNSNWSVSASPSSVITLNTKSKYLDKNIIISKIAPGSCTVSGGGLSQGTNSGGGLSQGTATGGAIGGGGLTSGAGSVSANSNISLSASDTFQCGLTVSGSGTVNRAAITRSAVSIPVNRAAFSNTVTRAAVTDAHLEGYIPAKNTTTVISSATTTVSLSSGTINATLASGTVASATKTSNTDTKYITGFTVPASKTFGSSSAKGALTLAAGSTATPTKAYMTMNTNSILYLTDAITGKTWTLECDSVNNALTINQE